MQRLRFADRLTIELDIAAEVRRAQVPDLLLQPLVENALLHGIERRPGDGTIRIRARRDRDQLSIEVADDGVATTAVDPADDTACGTGLGTTTARLHTLFGAPAARDADRPRRPAVCRALRARPSLGDRRPRPGRRDRAGPSGDYDLHLLSGARVPMSRTHRAAFVARWAGPGLVE